MTEYLDKIKKISQISVSKVCKKLKIDRANLMNGRSTEKNEQKVYEHLVKQYEDAKK